MKQSKLFSTTAMFGRRSRFVMLLLGIGIFGLLSFTYVNSIDPDPTIGEINEQITTQVFSDSENLEEYKYYVAHGDPSEVEEIIAMNQCPGGVRTGADPGPSLFLPKHKTSSIAVQTTPGTCNLIDKPCKYTGIITFETQPNQTMNYRISSSSGVVTFNNVSGEESYIFGTAMDPYTLNCGSFGNIVLEGQQANGTWKQIRVFRFVCVACPIEPIIIEN